MNCIYEIREGKIVFTHFHASDYCSVCCNKHTIELDKNTQSKVEFGW